MDWPKGGPWGKVRLHPRRDRPAWLRTRVVEGHAGQVLVEASAGAELLVVGNRGYGGFTVCCSVRSALTAFITHTARSPSSGPPVTAQSHRHQALQNLTTWAVLSPVSSPT